MKNLVLIGENGNLVVECLNGGFEFVHDKTNGSNWFNQKTLSKMFGVSQASISQSLKTLKKGFSNNIRNSYIINLAVKSNRRNSNMLFYNFKVVTMLASRINTPEAFDMLEWIDSSLNTMFNVATGQLDINTKREKLKGMQKVEEFKSKAYLDGFNALKSVDKERANELYHLHKVHYHNALNCYDLLVSENDWNDRFDVVVKQIDGKIDYSKQLTFDNII